MPGCNDIISVISGPRRYDDFDKYASRALAYHLLGESEDTECNVMWAGENIRASRLSR